MVILANLVRPVESPRAKILFLGYTSQQTSLINDLIEAKCEVWQTQGFIDDSNGFDLVICFGYRHILPKKFISESIAPIINLHISYLPWNRGAHPNFWSHYDRTPSGVTIHLVDDGVDTGKIIYQRYVNFNKDETTFKKTYERLIAEIEQLFRDNLDKIVLNKFPTKLQRGKGTYHRLSDLPKEFSGWDSDIQKEILRLGDIFNKVNGG